MVNYRWDSDGFSYCGPSRPFGPKTELETLKDELAAEKRATQDALDKAKASDAQRGYLANENKRLNDYAFSLEERVYNLAGVNRPLLPGVNLSQDAPFKEKATREIEELRKIVKQQGDALCARGNSELRIEGLEETNAKLASDIEETHAANEKRILRIDALEKEVETLKAANGLWAASCHRLKNDCSLAESISRKLGDALAFAEQKAAKLEAINLDTEYHKARALDLQTRLSKMDENLAKEQRDRRNEVARLKFDLSEAGATWAKSQRELSIERDATRAVVRIEREFAYGVVFRALERSKSVTSFPHPELAAACRELSVRLNCR